MKLHSILGFLVLMPLITSSQSERRYPQLGKSPLSEIIAAMTPDEKAIKGTGMAGSEDL